MLEWARFYFHDLRLHNIRPTPAPLDRDEHARHTAEEARNEWCEAHGTPEIPLDLYAQMREDARAYADSVRGPIPKIAGQMRGRSITDKDLVRMFAPLPGKYAKETQHHLERGICAELGQRAAGFDAQIDVDPRKGGRIMDGLADTLGLRVHTPRGGVHIFLRSAPGEVVHSSDGTLEDGVEVRVSGWALLPSGIATMPRGGVDLGRQWANHAAPLRPPPALLVPAPRPKRVARTGAPTAESITMPDGRPLGRCATLVMSEIGKGDGRTDATRVLVGILARPIGAPEDVVEALAATLVEYGAGRDWPAARIREEVTRWRDLLTRGPRDAVFAAEVVETWLAVRDIGPIRKGAQWARATARSMWKTADRREEGQAGAEDMAHLGPIGDDHEAHNVATAVVDPEAALDRIMADRRREEPRMAIDQPAGECVAADAPVTAEVRASDYVIHGPLCACGECKVAKVEAADADTVKREAFLRRILPFSADAYPDDVADKDVLRVPLRVESLYPFYNFWSVTPEAPDETEWSGIVTGHGYGRHLARAIGGLLPGSLVVVGGAGAKIGKTHFVGQSIEGLALSAAARILGIPGYQDAPIVMVTWVTEMPKPGEVKLRMLSRLFGFDMSAWTMATAAPESPGVVHMAERATAQSGKLVTPLLVVQHARTIVKAFRSADRVPAPGGGTEANPVALYLKHLQTEVNLSAFPAPTGTGRNYVDQASGVNLIGHVADGVALRRTELAARLAVAEDQITPIVVIDPGQRFIGGGESSKRELDAFLNAVHSRLCRTDNGVGAVVVMTSDTTKAAAKEIDLDAFLSESGPRLAADIFAGSQAMMHIPDTIIAVCGKDGGVPFRRTQYVRVLQSRTAEHREAYPFEWETFCGRFRPRAPEPLRDPSSDPSGDGGNGRKSGRRGPRTWSPEPPVGDHERGAARHPGYADR